MAGMVPISAGAWDPLWGVCPGSSPPKGMARPASLEKWSTCSPVWEASCTVRCWMVSAELRLSIMYEASTSKVVDCISVGANEVGT